MGPFSRLRGTLVRTRQQILRGIYRQTRKRWSKPYEPSAYKGRRACSSRLNRRQVAPAEIKEVVSSYSDKGDVKKVQSEGLHVAGSRYVTITADERSLYGKKV